MQTSLGLSDVTTGGHPFVTVTVLELLLLSVSVSQTYFPSHCRLGHNTKT